MNSDFADAHFHLATVYRRKEDYHAEEEHLLHTIALESDSIAVDYAAYDSLAMCLRHQGKFPEAEEIYYQIIDRNTENGASACNGICYHNLGECLVEQGRLHEAVGVFHQAIQIDERFHLSQRSLRCCLLELGRVEEAKSLQPA